MESLTTKVRLIARRAFGFRSAQALIALSELTLGGLCPPPAWPTVTVTGPTAMPEDPEKPYSATGSGSASTKCPSRTWSRTPSQ